MTDSAEEKASKFYNTIGWETEGDISEDAKLWEDLRKHARQYVSKCRLRVLRHIPAEGVNILDMASGPIQYKEYLEYSKKFNKRYCVDLSSTALEMAKKKIGDHGVYLKGSFFNIPLEENFFDCAISLHTIYHIDKEKQEDAVRKLIHVTKPGNPVIIVYGNPTPFFSFLKTPVHFLRKIKSFINKTGQNIKQEENPSLYYYCHPIDWWKGFDDTAKIEIFPWRSFTANQQKMFIPNNKIGSKIFELLFYFEDRFPAFFVKHFEYPMIVLTKK